MKNKSPILLLVLMFALALGVGVVAGKLTTRATPPPQAEETGRGTLSDILKLSDDQRIKMKGIWLEVSETSRKCFEDANTANRERDEELKKSFTPEDWEKYSESQKRTADKIGILDAKRRSSFDEAVKKSEAILDDSQRKIYQQIIKDRLGRLPDSSNP